MRLVTTHDGLKQRPLKRETAFLAIQILSYTATLGWLCGRSLSSSSRVKMGTTG
jgi:hypothetical protein